MLPLQKRASKVSGKLASKRGFFMNPLDELRQALGDANLLGVWWGLSGVTASGGVASGVLDARGAGFGGSFAASGTAQPAYDPTTGRFTFNGTTHVLKNTDAALAAVTGDCGIFFIGIFPAITATGQNLIEVGSAVAGGSQVIVASESATSGNLGGNASAGAGGNITFPSASTNYPGVRVLHARRTAIDASNITLGLSEGALVEAATSQASTALTAAVMVLAASRFANGNFAGCTALAWGLYKGNYTATVRAAVNEFALELGATL